MAAARAEKGPTKLSRTTLAPLKFMADTTGLAPGLAAG